MLKLWRKLKEDYEREPVMTTMVVVTTVGSIAIVGAVVAATVSQIKTNREYIAKMGEIKPR